MADAAKIAGDGLLDAFQKRDQRAISEKTVGDFVSDADRTAEDAIAEHLNQSFPGYGWLGEESGARGTPSRGLRWIVDPLDGTTNFLMGLPHWAVSIALYDNDLPLAALIHDPVKAETFSAERGAGAFLNGAAITVALPVPLSAMLLATGVPSGGRSTYLPDCLADLETLMPITAGIRRGGAAALDLAYVAAGRLHAYWERNLGPWDIAAGVLIVEEAGGEVQPLWPDHALLASGSFCAGHSQSVADILPSLSKTRR